MRTQAYGHAEAAAPSKMSMSSAQPMQAMPVLSSEEQPTYFIQQVPQQVASPEMPSVCTLTPSIFSAPRPALRPPF